MRGSRLRIFFDGGCRPNPGMMEIAVVARGVNYVRREIGLGNSHQAEWLALLHAVDIAIELGGEDIELIGDSVAVIGVADGSLRVREANRTYLAEYRVGIARMARVRLKHVGRSKNLAGIALSKAHPR